jgi:ABC-2 type transport system ATP-binding protein
MLHEVEQVSDQVVIIRRGKKLKEGSVNELLRLEGYYDVQLKEGDLHKAATVLRRVTGVESVSVIEDRLTVKAGEDLGPAINRALADAGLYASQITRTRSTLEDLFFELTVEPPEAAEP